MREIPKRAALQLLRAYKWAISPMFLPACRYVPTCSEYAMEAVERYGVIRGGLKSALRILRCHPFAHGGYDPVVKTGSFESASKAADSARKGAAFLWKSGALAPREEPNFRGFSPCAPAQDMKRNA